MPATTLTDRAVIRLSGEDVRGFLQGLVTSDVAGSLPVWAGLLTPQGKCLFDFLVWANDEDLLIDCEADAADDLIKRLSIYRLRRPITIERDAALAVHWSLQTSGGVADPRLAELGNRWVAPIPPPNGEGDHAEHGGGGPEQFREHRLSLGVCEGRAELGDLLWLECNAAELNGVSFAKGCFVGQENTARMNWRQKVNRRLFVVEGTGVERTRADYPELGLAVVHARVDAIPANAIIPGWLKPALTQSSTA
jgi:folate-binding protein YgfZ